MSFMDLWIGSYTPEAGEIGRGDGIYRLKVNPHDGAFTEPVVAATTPNPSWLLRHPTVPLLLAVAELDEGEVRAFAIEDDSYLRFAGGQSSGGALPCHLELSRDGDTVIAANYGDGVVSTHRLSVGGSESAPHAAAHLDGEVSAVAHVGTGPDHERQSGPHAHSSWLTERGDQILVCDLGTDQLRRYDIDEFGRLGAPEIAATLPAGSGPRHLVRHDNGFLYVDGELDSTVVVLRWDDIGRRARQVQTVPVAPSTWTDEDLDASVPRPSPSHLALDSTGRFLVVAARGVNVLSVYEIGDDGRLTHTGDYPSGGACPRHFAIIGDLIVVAHQDSDNIVSHRIDTLSGRIEATGYSATIPSAVCVVP